MKKLFMILPLVLVFCFTFSCQKGEEVAEEPTVDIAAEEAAVREAFMEWSKSGPAKDVEILMQYLADDVIRTGGTATQDKESIREWYTNWFSKGSYWDNQTIDHIVVSASGDLAYIIDSYEVHSVAENEIRSRKGCALYVFKKQADGSWKVAAF